MDFKFSAEDEAFRQEFRRWLEQHLPRDWRDDGELHDPDSQEEFERRRAWHRKLYDGGWMCIHWPKEYGGRGGSRVPRTIYLVVVYSGKGPATDNFLGIGVGGTALYLGGRPSREKR